MSFSTIAATNGHARGSSIAVGGVDAVSLRATAAQHLKAANALGAYDGVALPQMLNAALSMELYLKALAIQAGVAVAQSASWRLESLTHALQLLPEQIRQHLARGFAHYHGGGLEEQLGKFSKAFTQIRHHLQMPDFYEGFDLHEFMQLARFFGEIELSPEAE